MVKPPLPAAGAVGCHAERIVRSLPPISVRAMVPDTGAFVASGQCQAVQLPHSPHPLITGQKRMPARKRAGHR